MTSLLLKTATPSAKGTDVTGADNLGSKEQLASVTAQQTETQKQLDQAIADSNKAKNTLAALPAEASDAQRLLAMQLDHDTGRMDGEVLAGAYRGRKLSSLTLTEAQALHAQCAAATDQSRALFEAWIERTHPEWRAQWNTAAGRQAAASSQKMTRAEALAILGLKEGASAEDIRAAHRRLMKTAHPDLGGSDYLAAKINEAKEFLLHDGA